MDDSSDEISVAAGECVALSGWGEIATARLAACLEGGSADDACRVTLDGIDTVDLRPDILRSHVNILSGPEFFTGTIVENVHLHRPEVGEAQALELLQKLGITERIHRRGLTVTTLILPNGEPLTNSEQALLVLARGLVAQPRVLLIDHLLDGLPDSELKTVAQVLAETSPATTTIIATERAQLAASCPRQICPSASSTPTEG